MFSQFLHSLISVSTVTRVLLRLSSACHTGESFHFGISQSRNERQGVCRAAVLKSTTFNPNRRSHMSPWHNPPSIKDQTGWSYQGPHTPTHPTCPKSLDSPEQWMIAVSRAWLMASQGRRKANRSGGVMRTVISSSLLSCSGLCKCNRGTVITDAAVVVGLCHVGWTIFHIKSLSGGQIWCPSKHLSQVQDYERPFASSVL